MSIFDGFNGVVLAGDDRLEGGNHVLSVNRMKVLGYLLAYEFLLLVAENVFDGRALVLNDAVLVEDGEEIDRMQWEYLERHARRRIR